MGFLRASIQFIVILFATITIFVSPVTAGRLFCANTYSFDDPAFSISNIATRVLNEDLKVGDEIFVVQPGEAHIAVQPGVYRVLRVETASANGGVVITVAREDAPSQLMVFKGPIKEMYLIDRVSDSMPANHKLDYLSVLSQSHLWTVPQRLRQAILNHL